MGEIVPVRQADREAAADCYSDMIDNGRTALQMRGGEHDQLRFVQAFAAHAITARQEALGEAARVAEREGADLLNVSARHAELGDAIEKSYFDHAAQAAQRIASAIRGIDYPPLPNPERDLEAEAREMLAGELGCEIADLALYWHGPQEEENAALRAIVKALGGASK